MPATYSPQNVAYISSVLRDAGWTQNQISGAIGNLYVESKFDTNAAGDFINGEYTAFGIMQWRGDRWDNLQSFAAEQGLSPYSLEAQSKFIVAESTNPAYGEVSAYNRFFNNSETPEQAASSFMTNVERPNSDPNVNKIAERQAQANQYNQNPDNPIYQGGTTVPPDLAADGWTYGGEDGGAFYVKEIEPGKEISLQYDSGTGKWLFYDTKTGYPVAADGTIVSPSDPRYADMIETGNGQLASTKYGPPPAPTPARPPPGAAKGAGGKGGGAACAGGGMPSGMALNVAAGLQQGLGMGLNGALGAVTGALGAVPGLGAISGALSGASGLLGAAGGAINSLTGGAFSALSSMGAGIFPGLTNVLPSALTALTAPIQSILANPLSLPTVMQQFSSVGGLANFVTGIGSNMVGSFAGGSMANLINNIGLANSVTGISREVVGAAAEGLGQTFGAVVAGGISSTIRNMQGYATFGATYISPNPIDLGNALINAGQWEITDNSRLMAPGNVAAQIIKKGLGDVTGLVDALFAADIAISTVDSPLNDVKVKAILDTINSVDAIEAVRTAFAIGVQIENLGQIVELKIMLPETVWSTMVVDNFTDLGKVFLDVGIQEPTNTLDKIGSSFVKLETIEDLPEVFHLRTPVHRPSAEYLLKSYGFGSGTFGEITMADMMSSATGHVHNDTMPVIIKGVEFLKTVPEAATYFELSEKLAALIRKEYNYSTTTTDPDSGTTTTTEGIDIPGIGDFSSMDAAVYAMIAAIELALTNLVNTSNTKLKETLEQIDVAYNASCAQVLREANLWNQFDSEDILEPAKLTPIDAFAFTKTLAGYADETGYGQAADVIERLASDDFYGQSIVAYMRQSRNATILSELGVPVENYALPISDYYRNPLDLYYNLYTGNLEYPLNLRIPSLEIPSNPELLYIYNRDIALANNGYDLPLTPAQKDEAYGDISWQLSPDDVRADIGLRAVRTAIDRNLKLFGDSIELIDLDRTRVKIGKLTASGVEDYNSGDFLATLFNLVNKVLYGNIGVTKNSNPFFTDEIIYGVAELMGEFNDSNVDFLLGTRVGSEVMASFLTKVANRYKNINTVTETQLERDKLIPYGGVGPGIDLSFRK
jgi:hypothetical protein